MFERTYETSSTPHVTVTECLGDLVVRGTEANRVTLRLPEGIEEAEIQREGETFTITTRADCIFVCPLGTTLTIHTVRGDLKLKGVNGTAAIGTVNGDVALRAVGPTEVEHIYGDLGARQVGGDLSVVQLNGDGRIRQVTGTLRMERVGGTLRAEGIHGGLASAQVGADVQLMPPFTPGATYRVHAGSNLRLYLPPEPSVELALRAGGRIRSQIPELELEEGEQGMQGRLGAGEARVEAQVGGHISLRALESQAPSAEELGLDFIADIEGLGSAIEMRISEAMAEMQARLEESLGHWGTGSVQQRVEQAAERARRKAEQAAERARVEIEREAKRARREAEREAERARREAEREAERARLRTERAERRWQRVSGRRATPRTPQISDEEQMRILRMVEEGTISPEQAADLLAALEGR